jgi:hypothetical protein
MEGCNTSIVIEAGCIPVGSQHGVWIVRADMTKSARSGISLLRKQRSFDHGQSAAKVDLLWQAAVRGASIACFRSSRPSTIRTGLARCDVGRQSEGWRAHWVVNTGFCQRKRNLKTFPGRAP